MKETRFHTVAANDLAEWDAYVAAHPRGSIFHTSSMVRVFAATHHHEPLAVAALNDAGEIVAMLVAVRVSTIGGMLSLIASRSIMYAEPICNAGDEGTAALVQLIEHHDLAMKGNTLFTEVRPCSPAGAERAALEQCGYEFQEYLNYVADVRQSPDDLWRPITKSCRKDIRRTQRRGLDLREDKTAAGIERLYELLKETYGRSQVPLPDKSLFDATLEHLPHDWFRVVIAYADDRPVASSIDLVYGGVVFGWYGGTLRIPGLAANACITWDSIEWSARNNQRLYDFGGAGRPDEDYAVRDFKSKFGAELVRHGRYRKVYSRWKLAIAERAYEQARRFIAPTPSSIAVSVGASDAETMGIK